MGVRRDTSLTENRPLVSVVLPFNNTLLLTLIFLGTLFFTSLVQADNTTTDNQYGPTKSGQTLWEIAVNTKKRSPYSNKSLAVEQLVSAIYSANPKAFRSGNMNLLRTGAYLHLPSAEAVANTPSKEAKKELSQHTHALNLLRVDAKQLQAAKRLKKKHQRQTRQLQKQLAKYRHKSKAWNKTYKKYVTSKRNESKSKRKIASLSALLLEKATLKSVQVVVKPVEKATPNIEPKKQKVDIEKVVGKEMVEVNNRLGQIQSSLENLNTSNVKLVDQVQQLATLDERVKVLEDELGKNDELVLELKETLESAQKSIEEQRRESKDLENRLEELAKAQKTVNVEQTEDISPSLTATPSEATEETAKETAEIETEKEAFANPLDDLLTPLIEEAETSLVSTESPAQEDSTNSNTPSANEPPVNTGLNSVEPIEPKEQSPEDNDQSKAINKPSVEEQTLGKEATEGVENSNPTVFKEVTNTAQDTSELLETVQSYNPYILDMEPSESKKLTSSVKTNLDSAIEQAEPIKSSFAPNKTVPENTISKEATSTSSAHKSNGRNASETPEILELASQRIANQTFNSFKPVSDSSWSGQIKAWLKDNIFILASILNGLMLIFVISGFFSKKELKAEIEEELESKKQQNNNYVSWQDREKPKR